MKPPRGDAGWAVALLAGVGLSGPALPGRAEEPRASVKAEAHVSVVVLDAAVVTAAGDPVPGLPASAFRLRVDGKEVPLQTAEWIPAAGEQPGGVQPPGAEVSSPGRLVVVFFQTDFTRFRLKGQVRATNEAVAFLGRLLPGDLVAVASYDSRLKLRLDFTSDRARIAKAFFASLGTDIPPPLPPGPEPSLARRLDPVAARDAYSVELGLTALARALAPLPGAKTLLYFGWGLRVDHNPRDDARFDEAVRELHAARVRVHTLDVSDADWHTLEEEMKALSDFTGGVYEKTHLFTAGALDRTFRRMSGRYELVFEKPAGPPGWHDVAVDLPGGEGQVLVRPFYED